MFINIKTGKPKVEAPTGFKSKRLLLSFKDGTFTLYPYVVGGWKAPSSLFDKGTSPIHENMALMTYHLPKTLPPNAVALEIRFHHMDFGDTDIQTKQDLLFHFPYLFRPGISVSLLWSHNQPSLLVEVLVKLLIAILILRWASSWAKPLRPIPVGSWAAHTETQRRKMGGGESCQPQERCRRHCQ